MKLLPQSGSRHLKGLIRVSKLAKGGAKCKTFSTLTAYRSLVWIREWRTKSERLPKVLLQLANVQAKGRSSVGRCSWWTSSRISMTILFQQDEIKFKTWSVIRLYLYRGADPGSPEKRKLSYRCVKVRAVLLFHNVTPNLRSSFPPKGGWATPLAFLKKIAQQISASLTLAVSPTLCFLPKQGLFTTAFYGTFGRTKGEPKRKEIKIRFPRFSSFQAPTPPPKKKTSYVHTHTRFAREAKGRCILWRGLDFPRIQLMSVKLQQLAPCHT